MTNSPFRIFNNLSIRYKLFIVFFLSISVPFLIFTVVNYYVFSIDNENQALASSQKMLLQAKSILDYKVGNVKNVADIFALNPTTQELLNTKTEYYNRSPGNWMFDRDRYYKLLFANQSNQDILRIQLYMEQGLGEYSETEEFLSMEKVRQSKWYHEMLSGDVTYQWYPPEYFPQNMEKRYISILRIIPNAQNLNKVMGIIKADILESNIREILNQAAFTENTAVFLVNSKSELLSSSENSDKLGAFLTPDVWADLVSSGTQGSRWETIVLNENKVLMGVEGINKTNWKLFVFTPYNDILNMSRKSLGMMILILSVILPLTLPLSYVVAASSTNRIRKLISHMRRVVSGNFDVKILQSSSNDEIGELIQNYNYMLTRISMLLDDKFKMGKEIKSTELKALQSQINPHFLYNTLDMIYWMSVEYNAPKIGDAIDMLSKYYKLSLRKGEDIICIRDELEHVKTYVKIQNARFENRINLEISVPDELLDYKILKLTLQPLVENAIIHGIFEKESASGTVIIGGSMNGGIITLFVKDDGVGIPEEKLAVILTQSSADDIHGYGIRNINERLKLSCGSEYGLKYKSRSGIGTVVEIRIPAAL